MNKTISFQEVIEYVENLSQEDQDFLVELIKKSALVILESLFTEPITFCLIFKLNNYNSYG
jgi:hypothetical protein